MTYPNFCGADEEATHNAMLKIAYHVKGILARDEVPSDELIWCIQNSTCSFCSCWQQNDNEDYPECPLTEEERSPLLRHVWPPEFSDPTRNECDNGSDDSFAQRIAESL